MKKAGWKLLYRILPWVILAAAYLFSIGSYALYGQHNLDSDLSSEMVLADLLNEEGGFLSENWYYSTELRVVSPVPAYQLGLRLFDSWHAARTFALALLQAGMIASFLFMMRKAGFASNTAMYAAAAICLPFSKVHAFVFAHGAFYIVYFMLSCVVLGLVTDRSGRWEGLRAGMLILLGFIGGMSGIRMPMQLGVPLLMACALAVLAAGREADSYRALLHTRQARMGLRASAMTAAMLAGYVLNEKVLSKKYSFVSYSGIETVDLGIQRVLSQIEDMFVYFGYRQDKPLVSVYGLSAAAAILIVAFMFVSVCILLRDREKKLTPEERMIPLFAVCATALGLMINAMTGTDINRVYGLSYFLTGLLLVVASMFIALEKMTYRLPGMRTVLMLALTMVFLFQSRVFVSRDYRSTEANYEDFANWAVENGYTTGVATFWNANVMTEASDGKLDMYAYRNWVLDTLFPWLQKKEHFEALPEGKVIVFIDEIEHTDAAPCADEARMVYEGAGGRGYHFDSMQEVVETQREFRAELLRQRALQNGAQ